MKHLIILILLFSTTGAFAEDNNLVRFACQKYSVSNGQLLSTVVIVEQTSVKKFEDTEIINGSDMIKDPLENVYTYDTAFRMRIYNGVSLVSNEKTKGEIIGELLNTRASLDKDGDLMDFTGTGYRDGTWFNFDSLTPYDFKVFYLNLEDLSKGQIRTNSGAINMHEDGFYQCEEPVLIPISEQQQQ